jgi:cytochrome c-type biogenesis protein
MSLSVVTIFAAGVLTFLTPCVLPLIPIYLASLAGGDVGAISGVGRGQLLWRAILFSLGFVAVFTLMGLGASGLGNVLVAHKTVVQTLGGVVILLFGLKFVRVVEIPWLDRVLRADHRRAGTSASTIGALLTGVFFAVAWSPCVGPVLGSVLTYTASTTSSPTTGAAYLAAYGAGIALPLLLTAVFAEAGIGVVRRLRLGLPYFEKAVGVMLVAVAATLLFGIDLLPAASAPASAISRAGAVAASRATPPPTMIALVSKDCPICRAMEPTIAEVIQHCEGKNIEFKSIDISTQKDRHLVDQYRLVGVPTFVFLDAHGVEVARLIGKQTKDALFQALAAIRGESCPGVGPLPFPSNAPTVPPTRSSTEDGTTGKEVVSCQSTNTSATNVERGSISSEKSSSGTHPPLARAAGVQASACSLASP